MRKEARGTNAFQTNRNLKLSEHAWAESVPNLEIENNDVRCSHASTVGPIDEEQRFYLESRGVPPSVAERLIVAGFFDEVLERAPGARPSSTASAAEIAAKLDRAPRRAMVARSTACERLCAVDDLADGEARRFDVDGHPIAVVRIGDDCLRHRRHAAPTRTSRCPRARCTPTTARSSAGSTAARSRSTTGEPDSLPGHPSRCPCTTSASTTATSFVEVDA